jgi:hypothetical protein
MVTTVRCSCFHAIQKKKLWSIVGSIAAPASGIVGAINAVMRDVVGVVDAISKREAA